jgi:hypothetical protein
MYFPADPLFAYDPVAFDSQNSSLLSICSHFYDLSPNDLPVDDLPPKQ